MDLLALVREVARVIREQYRFGLFRGDAENILSYQELGFPEGRYNCNAVFTVANGQGGHDLGALCAETREDELWVLRLRVTSSGDPEQISATRIESTAVAGHSQIVSGDLDGDGIGDAVVLNVTERRWFVIWGTADGGFRGSEVLSTARKEAP